MKVVKNFSIVLLTCFFVLSVLAVAPMEAQAKDYNWKMQSVWRTTATQKALNIFADNVKKLSNGRIKIKVYAANELIKIKATREAVKAGAIEMASESGFYTARVMPEAYVEAGLPFSYRSWDDAKDLWLNRGVGKLVTEAYAEKGLHLIAINPAGQYCLMTTKPINKAEDLKGMKIRSFGPIAKTFAHFGATSTSIPGAEQYVALQRGTIDGTIYPVLVLDAYKLREVVKFVIKPSVINPPTNNIYMNLKLYKSLPKDLQEVIDKASFMHQAGYQSDLVKQGKDAISNFTKDFNGQVIDLPKAEVAKLREGAYKEWDALAAKNERTKKLINIVRDYMAEKGL